MPVEVYRDEREAQRDAILAQAGFGGSSDLRVARYSENADLARVHGGTAFHSVCLILSGGMTRIDRHLPTMVRGDISIDPNWFDGVFTNEGMTNWVSVFVRADRVEEMASDMVLGGRVPEILRRQSDPDPVLSDLVRACANAVLVRHPVSTLELDGWAQVIGAHLLRYHSDTTMTPRKETGALSERVLGILLEAIEADLDGDLCLASLARVVDMGTTRLSEGFRKSTGRSLHQYVLERRVWRARDLIDASAMTLAEIAFAVGFSSQSHMTVAFRDHFGTTPGRYRRDRD